MLDEKSFSQLLRLGLISCVLFFRKPSLLFINNPPYIQLQSDYRIFLQQMMSPQASHYHRLSVFHIQPHPPNSAVAPVHTITGPYCVL